MKGSPAKMGTISGTASHSSALKMKADENASALKQGNDKMSGNELVAIRKELKEKSDKLAKRKEEGKVTLFGKRKRRKTSEKIEENQALINTNKDALKWKKDSENKKETTNGTQDGDTSPVPPTPKPRPKKKKKNQSFPDWGPRG